MVMLLIHNRAYELSLGCTRKHYSLRPCYAIQGRAMHSLNGS